MCLMGDEERKGNRLLLRAGSDIDRTHENDRLAGGLRLARRRHGERCERSSPKNPHEKISKRGRLLGTKRRQRMWGGYGVARRKGAEPSCFRKENFLHSKN